MADNKNTQATDVNEQIKIRMDKLKALQDAGKDPFQITKYDVTHHTDEIRAIYEAHEKELLGDRPAVNTEGLDEQQAREAINADYNERRAIMDASPIEVSFAGRMMFKRVMGKASFCNIADLKGKMQAYISKDAIGEEAYADFKKSDIGDIFGVKGFIFRTKTGEISVHVEELTLLSKSLQVLPEKFHGITDTDMRYRQRYVDLIMNPEVKDTFVKRSKIIKEIRNFLDEIVCQFRNFFLADGVNLALEDCFLARIIGHLVIFWECNSYIEIFVNLVTCNLFFKARDELTAAQLQLEVFALAAFKCNTVYKTFEIDNGHIAVLNSAVFYVDGSRIALALSVDLSVNLFISYLNFDLVNLHTLVLAKSHFRLQSNLCGEDERLASL